MHHRTAPRAVPDHGHGIRVQRGCTHPACRAARAADRAADRDRKTATLVWRDGRQVQTDERCPHGTVGGYDNWVCRCPPCTTASSTRRSA